jgi:hypothetical protein
VKPVPKKKQIEPPDEQSKRFVAEAQRMIDAGALNPTEAERQIKHLLDANAKQRSTGSSVG